MCCDTVKIGAAARHRCSPAGRARGRCSRPAAWATIIRAFDSGDEEHAMTVTASSQLLRLKPLRSRVSEAEWQARVDLAACYRLCDAYGMSDMIYTHISARVPDSPDQFLLNPHGLLFDEVTASSLLKVDLDGNVLEKPEATTDCTRPASSSTARSIARGPMSTPRCTRTPSPAWRSRH
jgi:hypothetical protein